MTETANLVRLTKTEKKILIALLDRRPNFPPEQEDAEEIGLEYGWYPSKGNEIRVIAKAVYGEDIFDHSFVGPYVKPSVRSMMSRALKKLWREGLVRRCRPIWTYGWQRVDDETCFWTKEFHGLEAQDCGRIPENIGELGGYTMPRNTKVWWMLTGEGTRIAEDLAGITSRRKRCETCIRWDKNTEECNVSIRSLVDGTSKRILEPLKLDDCEFHTTQEQWNREWGEGQ